MTFPLYAEGVHMSAYQVTIGWVDHMLPFYILLSKKDKQNPVAINETYPQPTTIARCNLLSVQRIE